MALATAGLMSATTLPVEGVRDLFTSSDQEDTSTLENTKSTSGSDQFTTPANSETYTVKLSDLEKESLTKEKNLILNTAVGNFEYRYKHAEDIESYVDLIQKNVHRYIDEAIENGESTTEFEKKVGQLVFKLGEMIEAGVKIETTRPS